MKRSDNAVGDCKSGQFWQVRVCTERDEDCAVSLQISGRPYQFQKLSLLGLLETVSGSACHQTGG